MADIHYQVRVESDHLKRVASAKPIPALAELIWNAADADATRIDVEIDRGPLKIESVTVRDNGHGLPRDQVEGLFGTLGGSWKARGSRSKTKSRILHGKEGKGRFNALAIGRVADWTVVYRKEDQLLCYSITLIRDNLVDVRVSDERTADPHLKPGVSVRISELDRDYRSFEPERAVEALSQIFALYLTDYSDVKLFVEHDRVDPSRAIASRASFRLSPILDEEKLYSASVEVVEWTAGSERWFFFCDADGFPLHRTTPNFNVSGVHFSAYLKSDLISELHKRGTLDLLEMNPSLEAAYEEAASRIKGIFREKHAQAARSEIEKWKADEVYPYHEEPKTTVERAERKVFDIVALNVNRYLPDFNVAARKTKAFQLRMLRQAIESGPDELQTILREVLDLPERKQQELAKLLEEADLANVISASKLVTDRLKFIHGLEALLFGVDTKNLLKERSQLHRILAENNTWVFGERFSLTVDDESLSEVLRKHRKIIGRETVIDAPVKRIDGKVGIVDLMLSRSVPRNHPDEHEHLVIELKRPSVKIGADELMQVKKYAYTVASDERFSHLNTRWTFWVVSNDLDRFARMEATQKDKPRGQVSQTEDGKIEVWAKTWSEIISECKARLQYVQEKLKANVDRESSLKYLQRTYEKYLSGVVEMVDTGEGPVSNVVDEPLPSEGDSGTLNEPQASERSLDEAVPESGVAP